MGFQKGFNLVELAAVVAILAILAGITYPVYTQHIMETRRSDAWVALNAAAAAQQRWHAVNFNYTDDLDNLGGSESPQGFYSIGVVAEASSFTLTATAKNSGIQVNDTGCTTLTLNQAGVQWPEGCW